MEDEIPASDIDIYNQGAEEDMQDYGEHQQDQADDLQYGGPPSAREPQGIWSFFNKILTLKDNRKVANLEKPELGRADLSVRSCEKLATVCDLLHIKECSDYFKALSENTLTTSMSKKGWLVETTVSQKRYTTRAVQPTVQPQQKKPFLNLGGNKQPQGNAQ